MSTRIPPQGFTGRGALANPPNRFDAQHAAAVDDGWFQEPDATRIATELRPDHSRSIIARNDSPDIAFDQSINPYRGCEHGCVFCYARPTHAYLGWSPGLDFETRLTYKPDAAALLRAELARPGYRCRYIMLGSNTDAYQPVERQLRITRGIIEVLAQANHPVAITTRSTLLLRDLDLLAPMAARGLVHVIFSLTTLDPELKRRLEPRSAATPARLHAIRSLREAGVPVSVLVAPVIPALNDSEIETLLEAAAQAGAQNASYVLLRLPLEVAGLFRDWLATHYPDRAQHVMSLVQDARGGSDNSAAFGERMRGTGVWAQLLRDRFRLACRRLKLESARAIALDTTQFRPPAAGGQLQMDW